MFTMTPASSVSRSWALLQLSTGEIFILQWHKWNHQINVVHISVKQSVTFGTFCCSSLTRWYSRVIFQTPNEELIDGFRICFVAALQNYYKVLKRKQTHIFSCLTSWSYIPNTHLIGHLCICLRCRRTTSSLTRSWCIETACQRGSWDSWSSTRSRSWSSVSGPFPATLQSWLSSWSKNASAPPFTPMRATALARLHLELFWITPSLKGTGWFWSDLMRFPDLLQWFHLSSPLLVLQ